MMLPSSMQVLERGWLSSNNIVFIGADQTAIVDTGYASHAQQTLELVQQLLKGRKLDTIYNTHLHSDHCGGNKILQDHYAVRTVVPAAEMVKVQQWDRTVLSFQATDFSKALDIAHSRLDYLQADPLRNAQNAVKVLLKFLLLDRKKILLSEVPRLLSEIPLVSAANTYYIGYGTIHLAHWAITQLRRSGAVQVEGNYLLDC
jgi:flavorubredoxin